MPIATVLMSVYNSELHLADAIDSVLFQDFDDFEFLIIDDCSIDRSLDIIKQYSDKRIRIIENKKNVGLAASLNVGIDHAKGKYLLRMDADDLSRETRFSTQIDFMEDNKDIDIAGSYVRAFSANTSMIWEYPVDNFEIKKNLLFRNCLAHPSVVIKKNSLTTNNLKYDTYYRYSQDWELWQRSSNILNFSNIPEVLVDYRLHGASVGASNRLEQQKFARMICRRGLDLSGIYIDDADVLFLSNLLTWKYDTDQRSIENIEMLLLLLHHFHPSMTLKSFLSEHFLSWILESRSIDVHMLYRYLISPLSENKIRSFIKIFLKNLNYLDKNS